MKKLLLLLIPFLAGACSDPGASDSMPFAVRFVVHDEKGALITEGISITYLEQGEEIPIDHLKVWAFDPKYQKDTFATHLLSIAMADRASSERTNTFYLKHDGYTDTLTLLYEEKGDMDYSLFQINGKEIVRDKSKLWPGNYITINKK